jgi:hypothetical protein
MTIIGSRYESAIKQILKCYREGDYEVSSGNNTCYLHPKDSAEKGEEMIKIKLLMPIEKGEKIVCNEEIYFICRKGLENLLQSEKPKIKELVFA